MSLPSFDFPQYATTSAQPGVSERPRLLRVAPTEPPYLDPDDDPSDLPAVRGQRWTPLLPLPAPARITVEPIRIRAAEPAEPTQASRAADAELDALFGARRTPRTELPDPRPRAAAAIRVLLEVLVGDRPARQIAGWVSPAVLEGLESCPRSHQRRRPRQSVITSMRVSEPADSVAEVAAVVTTAHEPDARRRAVALRLEGRDGRWFVTAFAAG